MRKTIVPAVAPPPDPKAGWINLAETASVEVTSEDPDHPAERAFDCQTQDGWRAADPGEQKIGIVFDAPASIRRIRLRFKETEIERTQEFTLQWFDTRGASGLVVRQQWNFSPTGSTEEVEDYHVNLEHISKIELAIRPGTTPGSIASLDCWQMA